MAIDVVYTWVDGSDPRWLRNKREHLARLAQGGAPPHVAAHSEARFLQRDELRYSLRSLERYAPFVRRVYVVTAGQRPRWMVDEHPDLRVVDHEEIFPEPTHLPTFNSRAIEANLWRIPDLSECFLYLNDDILFSAPVSEADFFDERGRCVFYVDRRVVHWGPETRNAFHPDVGVPVRNPAAWMADPDAYGHPLHCALRNNSRLLEERFSFRIHNRIEHVPQALRRSLCAELWSEFPKEMERTSASRFRSEADLTPTFSLAQYYAYCTGRAVPRLGRHLTYVKLKRIPLVSGPWNSWKVLRTIPRKSRRFLSINDSADHSSRAENSLLTRAAVALAFRLRYPRRSRFER